MHFASDVASNFVNVKPSSALEEHTGGAALATEENERRRAKRHIIFTMKAQGVETVIQVIIRKNTFQRDESE